MCEDLKQVPVVADRHFAGMISRANILQVLQSRVELRKAA